MPERPFQLKVSGPAQRDLQSILEWSGSNFGEVAALRYEALLTQALFDLLTNPLLPGSKSRPELMKGVRTYHLFFSRDRVRGERVLEPRHFIIYRVRRNGIVEISRILHESRDLKRHLPDDA